MFMLHDCFQHSLVGRCQRLINWRLSRDDDGILMTCTDGFALCVKHRAPAMLGMQDKLESNTVHRM